jgi:hypothetical protein
MCSHLQGILGEKNRFIFEIFLLAFSQFRLGQSERRRQANRNVENASLFSV